MLLYSFLDSSFPLLTDSWRCEVCRLLWYQEQWWEGHGHRPVWFPHQHSHSGFHSFVACASALVHGWCYNCSRCFHTGRWHFQFNHLCSNHFWIFAYSRLLVIEMELYQIKTFLLPQNISQIQRTWWNRWHCQILKAIFT